MTQNIKVLCDVNKLCIERIFKSCPKHFSQLLTIHGLKNDVYLPLVFFYYPKNVIPRTSMHLKM